MDEVAQSLEAVFGDGASAMLASILDLVQGGVLVTDAASRIRWANSALCALTGYRLEELVGRTPALFQPESAEQGRAAEMWDSLGSAGRFGGRLQNRRADGSLFHAEVSVIRLPAPEACAPLFVCTMKDVTADVALERHLALEMSRAVQARDTTIFALASLAEQRDPEAGLHLRRIEEYTVAMAQWVVVHHPDRLPSWARDAETIGRCARLHDIGKVGVADAVLRKPGPLDEGEQAEMRRHPALGAAILDRVLEHQPASAFLRVARDIVAYHHEAYDGSGYPYGLVGEEIPLHAQLAAVADVLDALTSKRPYKEAHPFEAAVAWIAERRGTLFAPLAVDALLERRERAAAIALALGDPPTCPTIGPSGIRTRDAARTPRPSTSPPSAPPSPSPATALVVAAIDEALASVTGGEVVVRSGAEVGRVYVSGGRVAWAYLAGDRRTLADALVDEQGLSREDLREVVEECKRTGRNFGETLVAWGVVSRDALRETLRRHVGSRFRRVLALEDAHALFVPLAHSYSTDLTFSRSELLEEP